MSFYSEAFALFFAVVVLLYFSAPQRLRVPVLLGASVLFYISFVPKYIFYLAALILVDYCAGLLIERSRTQRAKRAFLIASLTANIGFMAAFKYSADVTGVSLGIIPIGLSFHTFQAMAYTIEVYRGRQPAERSLPVYALYVLFFPQIAAGPIERPQNLIPQFRELHKFSYANAVGGLQLMAWGLFQKYVVAGRLGAIVDSVYGNYSHFSGPMIAFAAVCFSFQILCDFAGYSDIAIGAAQVMGFRLTCNFNSPFHADSMAEYWKRWHISLSSWMRDYVFFPLCGRRPGMPRICSAIVVVFLANGLWHGARWNYLISGLLHGAYRVTELLTGRAMSRRGWVVKPAWERPVKIARTILVFSLMTFAFMFFRGENLSQTMGVIGRLFSGWDSFAIRNEFAKTDLPFHRLPLAIVLICAIEAVQFFRAGDVPLRLRIAAQPAWLRWGVYYAAAISLLILGQQGEPFIYFQF